MTNLIFIVIGGAAGTLLRYSVSGLVHSYASGVFPWGTLVVNLSGCLVIGFLWQMFENLSFPPHMRSFVFIGILGAYTTFSTYGLETFNLLREREIGYLILNFLGSNVLGLGMVFLGFIIARYLFSIAR
jgi:CrcB protein